MKIRNPLPLGRGGCQFKYFPQNKKNKSYFVKRFGEDVVLFVLDSGHIEPHYGKQSKWLKKQLEKYKDCSVKIAMYHVPIYPSIRFVDETISYRFLYWLLRFSKRDQDANSLLSIPSQEGKKTWLPLFDTFQITTAFEHHEHTLKRTLPLRENKLSLDGTIYLGDGGWGPEIQVFPLQSYFSSIFAKPQGYLSFFWLVDIKEDKILYQAISSDGNILDKYSQKII